VSDAASAARLSPTADTAYRIRPLLAEGGQLRRRWKSSFSGGLVECANEGVDEVGDCCAEVGPKDLPVLAPLFAVLAPVFTLALTELAPVLTLSFAELCPVPSPTLAKLTPVFSLALTELAPEFALSLAELCPVLAEILPKADPLVGELLPVLIMGNVPAALVATSVPTGGSASVLSIGALDLAINPGQAIAQLALPLA